MIGLQRKRTGEVKVHLPDMQGNILRAYGFPHTGYVFVNVTDPDAGRSWLADITPWLTSAEPWAQKPPTTLNIAMTNAGLKALGVPDSVMRTFPDEFRQGMAARADKLGDSGQSSPENWEQPLGHDQAHVIVMIDAQDQELLDGALQSLHEGIARHSPGVSIGGEQRAAVLPFGREHFGFSDGFSQPAVEGSGLPARPGQGTPTKRGWRPLKPGEFVLGYEDEDGVLPDSPAGGLGRNGTFMVYRKLYQDVALFRRFVREAAERYEWNERQLAAKIVGRWDDGTPMTMSPDAPDPEISEDKVKINDFRYKDDLDGAKCPLGSHVRRSNPRDALGWEGKRSFRHRIIRRGMPFGDPLAPETLDDDGAERGLIFVCFNASLARQFETVQHQWCSDGNLFGLGGDTDFLLGHDDSTGKMTIQGDPPRFIAPRQPLVVTRGGEYFFVPGLDAVRMISGGVPEIVE